MILRYTRFSSMLREECTKEIVRGMLRNRGYSLEETRYKKDRGLVKVYMRSSLADPQTFKIGEYWENDLPNWRDMYDAAMAYYLETHADAKRRDGFEPEPSSWLPR